jgi:hypothetical protein
MRSFGAMAIGGIAGIVILKLLAALVFPFFGIMFGVLGTVMKLALWIAIGYFVYTLIRGRRKDAAEV